MKHRRSQDKDRVPKLHLALREINENLTFTESAAWVWFALPAQQWAFRSEAQRLNMLLDSGDAYATLSGHRLHLRVTSRPYPAASWARGLDQRTPAPLGGTPNDTWGDHLVRVQQHLRATTMAEKEVYVGVRLVDRRSLDLMLDRMLRRVVKREVNKVVQQAERITEIVTSSGFAGRPATAHEMEWLMRRSVGLGLPAPGSLCPAPGGRWETEDLHSFTDAVRYEAVPFAPTVRVIGRLPDGAEVERHVAVLSVGKMPEIEVPDSAHEPWIAHTDRLPFPVEWSSRVDVLTGPEAQQAIQRKLLVVRDMQRHYREHDLDEPLMLERQARHARVVEDEMTQGADVVANRVHGWHRVAVWGATEEECLERARKVQASYRNRRIAIEHPRGQFGLMREFTPGEPLASTAYKRRMPALYFAAALPTVSANLGDRRGPYVGYTCGSSRRAVMFDTHFATEVRETSGLVPVVGGLGAGKSVLMGLMTYEAVRRGIPSVMLDPSGPLARLTELPELRDYSRHIDLTQAPPGTLNPFAVVAAPRRDQFADDDAFDEAKILAAQDRKLLALDVARMLLPPSLDGMPSTRIVLSDAVRATGGAPMSSLWTVIEQLEGHADPHGAVVANYLRDMAELPMARLFFPTGAQPFSRLDATLTVLTMPGLVLPPRNVAREHWSTSEQMAVPLLHLAAWYASRAIYGRDMHERKLVSLDEALALDTPLPTPTGWTTMGEVRPGDELIGTEGLPTKVLGVTEVMPDRACYRVTFADGTSMVASANHQWVTTIAENGNNPPRVRTTQEMHEWGSSRRNAKAAPRFRVPARQPLKTPEADLPIDPYLLGLWLGDGSRGQCYITASPEDARFYIEEINRLGEPAGECSRNLRTGGVSLGTPRAPRNDPSRIKVRLRDLGVFEDKHVPAPYLRASLDQRVALIQGLMDTDGYVDKSGTSCCTFVNGNKAIVDTFVELLRSLGQTVQARWAIDDRSRQGGYWRVSFVPHGFNPFRLPRKRNRVSEKQATKQQRWVTIMSIEPTETVPVRCVHVDAEDHLFVAGEGWQVTHNCHFLGEWSAGRALFTRLGRDSRKWNTCVFAASQNPQDVLGMDVANFIAAAFVGRIEDEENAADGLRMLRVPTGVGYERVLAMLSARQGTGRSAYREFVMRDVDGRVDKVRVDLSHNPGLLAALDTTAKPAEGKEGEFEQTGDDDEVAVA